MEERRDEDVFNLIETLCRDKPLNIDRLYAEVKRRGILTYDKRIYDTLKRLEASGKISVKNFRVVTVEDR